MFESWAPAPLAQPFIDGLMHRRLMFQRFDRCTKAQTLARYACQFCQAEALSWHESKGKGKVHSVTQVGRAPTDLFKALVPYTLAIVLLDEGFKVMGHAETGVQIDDVVIGDYVLILDHMLLRFQKR